MKERYKFLITIGLGLPSAIGSLDYRHGLAWLVFYLAFHTVLVYLIRGIFWCLLNCNPSGCYRRQR